MLALVVIVSPGIIGKLAEQSVDENLSRAVDNSGDLVITSTGFDRGWFSSEGEHRIEIGEGSLRDTFMMLGGESGDELPVLVINTRLDHGIIPVSSMSRDEGSLVPGLGSAISRMHLELASGEVVALPGTVYSNVGLGGDLDTRYELKEGSQKLDDGEVNWKPTTIEINSASGGYEFRGDIGGATVSESGAVMTLGPVTFSGNQQPNAFGFYAGDLEASFDKISVDSIGANSTSIDTVSIAGTTRIEGDRAVNDGSFSIESLTVPGFGEVTYRMRAESNVDAAAFGRLMDALKDVPADQDSSMLFGSVEPQMKDLVAGGLDLNFPQFDVVLPGLGTVKSVMSVSIESQDADSFEWTSLLLKTKGSLDLRVPSMLVTWATSANPQASGLIAAGYLQKEGNEYVMEAKLDSGVLTINGAPTVIPPGLF